VVTTEFFQGQHFDREAVGGEWRSACRGLIELLRGLQFLHESGIVHADIKPTNILCRREEAGLALKLFDYHLSVRETDLERARARGTLLYMAPEVIGGRGAVTASDLYSVGVVLYEALTGAPPFVGAPAEVAARHLSDAVELPEGVAGERQPELHRILRRLLGKNPGARYSSAAAVIQELGGLLGEDIPTETADTLIGRIRSAPCVGRDELLEEAEDALECAGTSEQGPVILLLQGADGAGKSRLLREWQVRVQCRGVLTGRLDGHAGAEENLRVLERNAGLEEGQVSEPGAEPFSAGGSAGGLPPALLSRVDALADCLFEDSPCAPVVLLADNFHEAGPEQLEILSFLLRSAGRSPLVCGLAAPDRDLPDHVRGWLEEWKEGGDLRRLDVEDLQTDARRALMERVFPESTPEDLLGALARDSGSRPGVLMATLEHMVAAGGVEVDAAGRVEVQEDIERLVPANLRELAREVLAGEKPAADAVKLLAVAGGEMELDCVGKAIDEEAGWVRDNVLFGPARDLISVTETSTGMICRLQHRGIGEAVVRTLSAAERRRLHDQCAAAIAATADEADMEVQAEMARHQLSGTKPRRGVEWVNEFLKKPARGKNDVLPLDVIQFALKHTDGQQRTHLLETAVRYLAVRGRFSLATNMLHEAVESGLSLRNGERTLTVLAESFYLTGHGEEAGRILEENGERFGVDVDRRESMSGSVQLSLGRMRAYEGQFDEAVLHCKAALSSAREKGDSDLEANALRYWGRFLVRNGRLEAGCEKLEEALSIMQANGREAGKGRVLSSLGYALMLRGQNARAVDYLREGLALLRSAGRLNDAARALNNLGTIHQRECNWEAAARRYRAAQDLCERLGCMAGAAPVILNLAEVNITRGYIEEGISEAEKVARNEDMQPHWRCYGFLRLAWGYSFLGDQDTAFAHCQKALDISQRSGAVKLQEAAHRRLGQIELLRGKTDVANSHLEASLSISRKVGLDDRKAVGLFRLAELELSYGHMKDAITLSQKACERSDELKIGSIHALTRWVRGKAALEQGRAADAMDDLREAERFFAEKQMCEELIDSAFELGRAHYMLDRPRSALRYLALALNVVEEIAERMESDRNRQTFLSDPRRSRLFDLIGTVKDRMTGEK
jgi:tetratricopeptide (TPR) repeat protein